MPMTHIYWNFEQFGSHCVAGMSGPGNVGFTDAIEIATHS